MSTPENNITPEYLRVKDVCRIFSVSRSWLYQAMTDGRIKSYSVRPPGTLRGLRLIETQSVRDLITSSAPEA